MITILDGGMGRELFRSGAPFRQPEWSALALMEAPEHVARVHQAFAEAGADIITTNSYAVVPFHIGKERFDSDGARLARLAGSLAREVATRTGVKVAGSIPPLVSYRPDLFVAESARSILSVLIEALSPNVDVWLAETQSSLAEVQLISEMLASDDRPLWVSFTLEDIESEAVLEGRREPTLRSGESVSDATRLVRDIGGRAIMFNCSQPEVMEAAVKVARATLGPDSPLRIGVYANAFTTEADDVDANVSIHDIRTDLDPTAYSVWPKSWVAAGATMIGGCCGISPEHIKKLRSELL